MTISLGNALLSVKEDEKWIKKIIIGGLLFIPLLIASYVMQTTTFSTTARLISFFIYLLLVFFVSGFFISTANKAINTGSYKMTDWTEKDMILKGIKYCFSTLVYIVVFTLLSTIISLAIIIVAAIILGIIYYLLSLVVSFDCQTSGTIFGAILGIVYLAIFLYIAQFINASYICYFKNLRFKDIMALRKQFRIVTENQHAAWSLIGKLILYVLLFTFITLLVSITIIGVVTVPFILFAAYVTMFNLYVQYGREVEIEKYLEE